MFPLTYGEVYKTPADHNPPDDAILATDTEYPNLNSRDYAKRPLNRTMRLHPSWECITLNKHQQVIVGTNKLCGREWTGSVWGFETVNAMEPGSENFKLQCNSIISNLQYLANDLFIMSLHNGKLQLWSTRSELRNSKTSDNPYCLYLVDEKSEHTRPILCMDVVERNENSAVTGCSDGTLKLWDFGASLLSKHTFRFAHKDTITGVQFSKQDNSIIATCSLDKSALLWDVRLTRPAIALYGHNAVRFKTIAWSDKECDAQENTIYLGDETGSISSLDKRVPDKFICTEKILNFAIRKILPNGNNLVVIGDSKIVKVVKASNFQSIYENMDSKNIVRDVVWSTIDEFYTIGYEGKLRSHKLSLKDAAVSD